MEGFVLERRVTVALHRPRVDALLQDIDAGEENGRMARNRAEERFRNHLIRSS